jgi:Uncharacterized protein conserved in bacteria
MTREQFQQFWLQLKGPLKETWDKLTDSDVEAIQGDLATFMDVLQKRYGDVDKHEVRIWVDRRHAYWSGNYVGYKDPQGLLPVLLLPGESSGLLSAASMQAHQPCRGLGGCLLLSDRLPVHDDRLGAACPHWTVSWTVFWLRVH